MSQARPTAAELVRAVSDMLKSEALPQLEGATRFHTRVSVHALDIVARELELGPELDGAEHARLRALLGTDGSLDALERTLAARIRDGSLDERRAEVLDHVRQTVKDALRIAHPGYTGD